MVEVLIKEEIVIYIFLSKCVLEDEDSDEALYIPIPITKTDKWYNDLKFINKY